MKLILECYKERLEQLFYYVLRILEHIEPWQLFIYISLSIFLLAVSWLLATGWGEISNRWQITLLFTFSFLTAGVATVWILIVGLATTGAFLYSTNFRSDTQAILHNISKFFGNWLPAGFILGFILSALSWWIIRKRFQSWVGMKVGANMQGRSDKITDVRQIEAVLPQPLQYNPTKYFNKAFKHQKIFFGIDEDNLPVYIDRQKWKKTHVQVCGPTGTGKGVMSCVCLSQSISYGDAVFVIDPKNDEYAPSVLKQECDRAGKPFTFINLNREHHAQLNLLKDISQEDLNSLFIAGFSLGEKGTDADFYKKGDRKAARLISKMAQNGEITIKDLAEKAHIELTEDAFEQSDGFRKSLEEIAEIESVSTTESLLDLADPIKNGGCLYIVGNMEDEAIVILQKMILLRIVQLVKNRPRNANQRHVTIFADEIRYLMSKKLGDTLGSVRDKNCNLILAHQSLDDLHCGDVPSPAVVIDNTGLRWLYRSTTEEMAKWISSQTGRILVGQESVRLEQNEMGSETGSRERTIRQIERNKIDTNMVQNLPDSVAVMIGAGGARMGYASPIQLAADNKYEDNSALIYKPEQYIKQEAEQHMYDICQAKSSVIDQNNTDNVLNLMAGNTSSILETPESEDDDQMS